MIKQLPPHNIEAEENVISSILMDSKLIRGLPIEPDDFAAEHLKFCFQAARELERVEVSINQITLAQKLHELGKLEAIGGAAYLSQIIANCASPLDCRYYAQIVKKQSVMRGLIQIGNKIEAIGYKEGQSEIEAINKADELLLELRKKTSIGSIISPDQRADAMVERYNKLHDQDGGVAVSTGLNSLDASIGGGLYAGEMAIIAARPGMGKTTIVQNLANNIAERKHVLFCSGEMNMASVSDRDVAAALGITTNQVRQGGYDHELWGKLIGEGLEGIRGRKLHFFHEPPLTTAKILQAGITLQLRGGLDCIVVDYLGMLDDEYGKSQYERIGYCSRKLKQIAMQLNVPILVVAQLNRDLEKRDDKRPQLSDLRDSGRIEEDADVVMFIYRESYYKEDIPAEQKNITEILIAKQRQGEGFRGLQLYYDFQKQRYFDLVR